MVDLLVDAERTFVRMSETDDCRLKIAHNMIGTDRHEKQFSNIAMRMGIALEPMVVQFMADESFDLYFAGSDDNQLELISEGPYMVGHSDGLIAISQEPSWWAQQNLPAEALDIMVTQRQPMLLEIKTMNEDTYAQFVMSGLAGGKFIKKYLGQTSRYLGTLTHSENDEHWESGPYRELMREQRWNRPTHTLLVAFSPGIKQFAFEVLEFDEERYEKRSVELQEGVLDKLHAGILPEPDFDGQAADCFFCPFAYVCPAVQKVSELRSLDSIPIDVLSDAQELNSLAEEYHEINEQWRALDAAKKALRRKLNDKVTAGSTLVTSDFVISMVGIKGRRSIDQDAIAAALGIDKKDLPHKTGNPYSRLQVQPLFGPSSDGDT